MLATLLAVAVSLLPQGPLQVEVTPRGKSPVSATWSVSSIAIETEFGSANVKGARLAQIQFGEPDVVLTDSGVELRGQLKQRTLELKVDGKQKRMSADELALLVVVRDGKALGLPSFAGEWMTSFGPAKLTQKGAAVRGEYGFGGNGTIEGTIKNGVLEFAYHDDGGSGGGNWKLEGDDALFGRYGRGGKDEGFWGGYRKVALTPMLRPGEVVTGQTTAGLRLHVRVPKSHKADSRWPAICILHGSNMTSRAYVDTIVGTWPELAEQFVIVGLDGERLSSASKPGELAFNYTYINFGGPEVGPAWAHRQSPALVAESLQQLQKELPITRWYLGGHSQGGFLTYCLAMYYPELLAGVFPMSCNLLVQCEPDEFDDKQRQRQHELAFAVIHGRGDDVVEFDGGAYCHLRLLDGGFPRVRLFAPEKVGHQFAWLPVDEAVRWLQQSTSDDAGELLAFAEARAKDGAWRDVGAVLQRLERCKPDAGQTARAQSLRTQLDGKAQPDVARLANAIAKNKDGKWADDFLAFRADYATAPAAASVMTAYDALRRQQQKRGDELFQKARSMDSKDERFAVYRELLSTCYATKWYAAVKLWMQ